MELLRQLENFGGMVLKWTTFRIVSDEVIKRELRVFHVAFLNFMLFFCSNYKMNVEFDFDTFHLYPSGTNCP